MDFIVRNYLNIIQSTIVYSMAAYIMPLLNCPGKHACTELYVYVSYENCKLPMIEKFKKKLRRAFLMR